MICVFFSRKQNIIEMICVFWVCVCVCERSCSNKTFLIFYQWQTHKALNSWIHSYIFFHEFKSLWGVQLIVNKYVITFFVYYSFNMFLLSCKPCHTWCKSVPISLSLSLFKSPRLSFRYLNCVRAPARDDEPPWLVEAEQERVLDGLGLGVI